jgi:hypothetical protein
MRAQVLSISVPFYIECNTTLTLIDNNYSVPKRIVRYIVVQLQKEYISNSSLNLERIVSTKI